MKTYFTYSNIVKVVTCLVLLVTLPILVGITLFAEELGFVILLLTAVVFVPIFYAPCYYELRAEGLYIRRLGFGRLYSYIDYELSEEQGPIPIDCLRLWGSGGYCGFLGHYYSRSRGRFVMIATSQQGPFYLLRHRQTGRQIIVSQ